MPKRPAPTARRSVVLPTAAALALLALSGCAVEFTNTRAAQELARPAVPPGSVYTGWRVFQDKCAQCHGTAATGSAGAPDLLPRLQQMDQRRFVNLVLLRYDWGLPAAQVRSDGPAREALVDDIASRRAGALTMPAWQGEPRVNAHIADLYAYLAARAAGTQGPARPLP
jgi:mono/diheme cytochrome c family protein